MPIKKEKRASQKINYGQVYERLTETTVVPQMHPIKFLDTHFVQNCPRLYN